MEWYWYVWLICSGVFLVGFIVLLIYRIDQKKRYVFFQLLDAQTKQPLAGVQVRGLVVSNTYYPVFAGGAPVHGVEKRTTEKYIPLGYTDEQGMFKMKVSFLSYAAFWLESESPRVGGLIGRDQVSLEGHFPTKPFVCRVISGGMVQPPYDG
jgi:hypothetical protein